MKNLEKPNTALKDSLVASLNKNTKKLPAPVEN